MSGAEEIGTTPGPENRGTAGPVGRVTRILLGVIFLWLFIRFAAGYSAVAQPGNMVLYFWAVVGGYSHALGTLIPPLKDSGRRFVVLAGLAAVALLLNFLFYGHWWGLPLAVGLYGLSLAALGVLGVEFLLAGLKGYPGCESTALYNLLHRDSEPRIEPCPLWDPIDRWERRISGRNSPKA